MTFIIYFINVQLWVTCKHEHFSTELKPGWCDLHVTRYSLHISKPLHTYSMSSISRVQDSVFRYCFCRLCDRSAQLTLLLSFPVAEYIIHHKIIGAN